MASGGDSQPDDRPRTAATLWRRLALIFCLFVVVQDGHYAWLASGLVTSGTTGATVDRAACASDRFCPVTAVAADSPASRAGIVAGDHLRYRDWWRMYRIRPLGEDVAMTVRHEGAERQVVVRTATRSFSSALYITTATFQALLALTAALIVLRAGHRRTSLLLALAMASFAIPGPYPRLWQNAPGLYELFFVSLTFLIMIGPFLLAAAMLRYRREVTGFAPAWIGAAFWPVTILTMTAAAIGQYVAMNARPFLGISDGLSMVSILWAIGALYAASVLFTRWDLVPPVDRSRYAFMAAAAVALCVNAWIDPVIMLTTNNYTEASWPVVVQIVSLSLAAFLFAYAILRHRAVDLGFAVNRTLVYSVLSALMVAVFVLAEEAAERLLPATGSDTGMFIQAGIALAVFAVFDRLRNAVEGLIERIFFSRWRQYEARIRAFVRQSAFFTRPAKLIEQTIAEVRQYTDGAEVAIYRRTDTRYERVGGGVEGVGRRVDPDVPALVALRAERALQRGGPGATALLLPMVQRGEVLGFLAVGRKPDGAPYRPDEEQLLAETTQAVGLDLHALRVQELERENRQLSARIAVAALN